MRPRKAVIVLFVFCLAFTAGKNLSARQLPENDGALFCVAREPVPVLNVSDPRFVFGGKDLSTLRQDSSGLVREVEFIALPETVFNIKRTIKNGNRTVYEVTTADYPYPSRTGYYIDSRFVETLDRKIPDRVKKIPSKQHIIRELEASVGSCYIWGGNRRQGVERLLELYPPRHQVDALTRDKWMLKGLDCSGLLYEAAGGATPRNTSSLVNFGEPVIISGLDADGIREKTAPLDLIVWKGHVIIILDKNRAIESRLGKAGDKSGVQIRDLKQVLERLLKEKRPVDKYDDTDKTEKFVIRRWYHIR